MKNKYFFVVMLVLLFALSGSAVFAQEFGFGFDDDDDFTGADSMSGFSAKVGGEITVALTGYINDFSSIKKLGEASLGDMVSGALNVSASGAKVDAFIGLNLSVASFKDLIDTNWENFVYTPILDEAYLRAYFGPVNIEAGLRKLTWGKADSLGPLDVTNPLDYRDLRKMTDLQKIKIARPMVHFSWNTSGFSKLEAVFMPNFAGHRFAQVGRWMPSQFYNYTDIATEAIMGQAMGMIPPASLPIITPLYPEIMAMFSGLTFEFPDTKTSRLEYFQAGLRYTTTIGPADIGFQYFYGNLFQPDVTVSGIDMFLNGLIGGILGGGSLPDLDDLDLPSPVIKYNRYHQIGIDYAQVLFGFNLRSEFAVHLTKDLKGNDGSIRNPFLAWSIGFDRDLVWGINLNLQCNETIRLFNGRVGSNLVMDCEAGKKITSTRLTMQISKKFLRDELELKVVGIWGIEDKDCYILPSVVWAIGGLTSELAAGIFAGSKSGELGQYRDNKFVRLSLKYSF
jgi:hypothetical protein